jgi:hypothetical protein
VDGNWKGDTLIKSTLGHRFADGPVAAALAATSAAFAQRTIKLGVLPPVSGGAVAVSLDIRDRIKLAVEEIRRGFRPRARDPEGIARLVVAVIEMRQDTQVQDQDLHI